MNEKMKYGSTFSKSLLAICKIWNVSDIKFVMLIIYKIRLKEMAENSFVKSQQKHALDTHFTNSYEEVLNITLPSELRIFNLCYDV